MTPAMQELLDILDLEQIEHNLYRGRSPSTSWQRVFGGQVIGQSLVAAQRTVEAARFVHSLHCYFMRPGDSSVPIVYQVERLRDGGTAKGDDRLAGLTEQERKILDLIGEGLTNRVIGERLHLAEKTIKNYVSSLLSKLGMERRSQAAAYVARLQAERR